MNTKRSVHVINECLLNNIIDKEFQDALYPFHILESLFLMSKFNIESNFITPKNGLYHCVISMGSAALFVFVYYFRFYYFYHRIDGIRTNVVTIMLYFDLVFYSIMSFLNHFVNIRQCNNTVELIIRLQKGLNSIEIDKKRFLFRMKMENWICMISAISLYGIFWLWYGDVNNGFFCILLSVLLTLPMLIYDLHIINATRSVVFIRNELAAWNRAMEEEIKRAEEVGDNEVSETVTFDSYLNIVKAFRLCNEVYQFSVSYYAFQTFFHFLYNVELILQFAKSGDEAGFFQSTMLRIILSIWNLKNFVLLVALSVACENFYKTVKMAESCCARFASNDRYSNAAALRKTCKNVSRVNRAAPHKLSAYGLFEIDAAFPARLLGGVLAYTVVLLQFAFA